MQRHTRSLAVWSVFSLLAGVAVPRASAQAVSQGDATATTQQLRACRIEAERRVSTWSQGQIQLEPESRDGNVARVRWSAGTIGGICTVAANGRIVQFTSGSGGEVEGGGAVVGAGEDETAPTTTSITCQSRNNDRQECPLPPGARTGHVRLVRQLSANGCRLNDTYGMGPGYVWVAKGCRGEFEVTRAGAPGGTGVRTVRMVCQSQTAERQECPVAGATAVRLVQQSSAVPCRLNQTFGLDAGHMWTSNGCRGEFELTVAGSGGNTIVRPVRVTCGSSGAARTQCFIRKGGQVRLLRQLSAAACVMNRSWGTGNGVIWVTRGCRGEFEVR